MKSLTLRETLRHLDLLIASAPQLKDVFSNTNEAASFVTLCTRLRELLKEKDTSELSVDLLWKTLFPKAADSSRRVLFSKFRKTLSLAAEAEERDLAFIQPNLKGKDLTEVQCHFEGVPLEDSRQLITSKETTKLDNQIQSEARVIPDLIRIFISFANADKEKAAELKSLLESNWGPRRSHKVEFWMFNQATKGGLLAGEGNLEEIQKAMNSRPLALFLISPDWSNSQFITEHELPAYFPARTGKHPLFVNLRNSRPPSPHLAEELLNQFIFSHDEHSFEEQRGKTKKEQFASTLNDHIELLCQKHFGSPNRRENSEPQPEKRTIHPRDIHSELLPPKEDDFREIPSRFQRAEQGLDAVDDLLAWATDPDRGHYFALLGETGAGKTTATLMFARELNQAKGPIRVYHFDLRYANYDGLLERTQKRPTLHQVMTAILTRHNITDVQPEDYLQAVQKEGAILTFDGLDEIFVSLDAREQDSLMQQLLLALPANDARKDGAGKLLFACRTQFFRSDQAERGGLTLQGREGLEIENGKRASFELARMLPFTEEQIKAYFEANLPDIPFDEVWQLLSDIHELQALATQPYLLNLIRQQLPMINDKVANNEPVRAVDLYQGFISDWSHERNKHHNILQPEDKNELMELLAVHMWRQETKSLAAKEMERWLLETLLTKPLWKSVYGDLLKPASQESLLGDFRAASFVSRWQGDTFRFAHTSLQEYFVASHLAKSLTETNRDADEEWNLPMPSQETFDFLGQILLSKTSREQKQATAKLAQILGDDQTPEFSRLAALRYHIRGHQLNYPIAKTPDLAFAGLDLREWKIHGNATRPLLLGTCNFSHCQLIESSFEYVTLAPRANFEGSDLRGAQSNELSAPESTFRNSLTRFSFFRNKETSLFAAAPLPAPALIHVRFTPSLSPYDRPTSLNLSNGHSREINSVAFSPDDRFFLSGSSDNSIKIWDTQSSQCLRTFEGHLDRVSSVTFSPNENLLLSGSYDNSLKLWDRLSGQCIRSFELHSDRVTSVAFSPDGKLILSGSSDNSLKIWNPSSGKCLHSLEEHSGGITTGSFSPDGKTIVSSSNDHSLKLWSSQTGRCFSTLSGHTKGVYSAAFSPNGKLLVSGSLDETIRIWDAHSGRCLRILKGHSNFVLSVAFSPDGHFIISGSLDFTIKIWAASSGTCIRTLEGHASWIDSVTLSHDGQFLLSGSDDGTLKLWEMDSGLCIRSIEEHQSQINAVTISPNAQFLLSGSDDNSLRLWDIQSGQRIRSFIGHANSISDVAFSPDGQFILSGSRDNSLKLWDTQSGEFIRSFSGPFEWVTAVAFSPDGQFIVGQDILEKTLCWTLSGQPQKELPTEVGDWLSKGSPEPESLRVENVSQTSLQIIQSKKILREILPLPNNQSLVREPWDEEEGLKPAHEIRWKLVSGPADAWRYCNAIDPETLEVHPPEYATENGTWEIT